MKPALVAAPGGIPSASAACTASATAAADPPWKRLSRAPWMFAHRLEARMAAGLLAEPLEVRREPGTQMEDGRGNHREVRAQLQRPLGVQRRQLGGERRQRVDGAR